MSAADDVYEMQTLCDQIADRLIGVGREKERISAVSKSLGVGWNRALEFLRGKARRIDSWEKDNARRQLAELRDREQQQRATEHLAWLECEISRHRASGAEFRGPHVDALEHLLRLARSGDGSVAVSPSTDAVAAGNPIGKD